jgi:2-polyprenyl-6-hydroxyphenyl methylase/3-demethylubiquinone-9 3-methyltransferase
MSDKELIENYGWKEPKTHAHNYLLPDIERILCELEIPRDAVILDAGCGGGYVAHELYERGYKNIWGFDASEAGLAIINKSYIHIKNRFEIHNAYHRELPDSLPKKDYDIVLSVEVVEHLYSPKEYLGNISFWLKKGGFLIITTPYHGYIKNLTTSLLNKSDKHFNPLLDGGHVKFFSKRTLYKLLEEVGIRPLKFCGSGRLPFLWKSMIVVARNE